MKKLFTLCTVMALCAFMMVSAQTTNPAVRTKPQVSEQDNPPEQRPVTIKGFTQPVNNPDVAGRHAGEQIKQISVKQLPRIIPSELRNHDKNGGVALNSANDQRYTRLARLDGSPESIELIDMRDQYSRTFQNPDGSFSKQQFNTPMHFLENGKWVAYSDKLVESTKRPGTLYLECTNLPIFLDANTGLTKMQLCPEGGTIQFGENAVMEFVDALGNILYSEKIKTGSNYSLEENTLKINEAWLQTDRTQKISLWEIETDYVIKTKPSYNIPAGKVFFKEFVQLPDNWKVIKGVGSETQYGWEGEILIVNAKGDQKGTFLPLVFYDSDQSRTQNDHAIKGSYVFEQRGSIVELVVVVPADWLFAAHRAFPVTIDPTVTGTNSGTIPLEYGGFYSTCQNTLTINVPAGTITNTATSYSIVARNSGWKSEQRSRVNQLTNGSTYSGSGTSGGTQSYSYNTTVANGTWAGGNKTFVWQGYRTWGLYSSYCETYYQYRSGTWSVTVTYTASSNCTGTPNAGTASISASSGCPGNGFTVSASGLSTGNGISYQWQTSPNGSSWTNISGATGSSYNTSTGTTAYYRLKTTCSYSGGVNYTNSVSYTVLSNCCTHTILLYDDFGDGFNGGYVNVYVGGALVGSYTLLSGTYAYVDFSAADGQSITVTLSPVGTYPDEINFLVFDGGGNQLTPYWWYPYYDGPWYGTANCPCLPTPVNDNCSGALSCGTLTSGVTCTLNGTGTCSTPQFEYDNDTWIAFTVPCYGMDVTIDFCGSPTTHEDIYIILLNSGCNMGSYIYYTTYGYGCGGYYVTFEDLPPGTYYYPVLHYGGYTGAYKVNVTGTCPFDPCTAITSMVCNTTYSHTLGSSGSWSNEICGWATPGAEKIFSFTPTTSGTHTINMTTDNDFVDFMYQAGSCGYSGWTCIGDIITSGTYSLNMTAGTTYYFLADKESYSTSSPTIITMSVTCPCITPGNPGVSGTSTVCQGGTSSLSATSTNATTIYWYTGGCGTTQVGTSTPGANFPVNPSSTTTYYAMGYNSAGAGCWSAGCGSITVTVLSSFSAGAITGPGSSTQCYGYNPTSLTANPSGGAGTYAYQWQSSPNGSSWANIGSATAQSYDPPALASTNHYRVMVDATGSPDCGGWAASSNTIAFTVYPAFSAGNISGPTTGTPQCSGYNPTAITANPSGGAGTYAYQWQSSPNGSSWTNVSSATAQSFDPPALTTTTHFRVMVDATGSPDCGGWTESSNAITYNILSAFSAGNMTGSSSQTVCSGYDPPVISANPSGGVGTYAYQWQSNTNGTGWTNISGATSQTYDQGGINLPYNNTYSIRVMVDATGSPDCGSWTTSGNVYTYTIESTLPAITCPGNISVNTAPGICGAPVSYTTPVGTDNCSATTSLTGGYASGATFPKGTTTNTFRVVDGAGNSAVCSFTVTVTDAQAPAISCPGNIAVNVAPGTCAQTASYSVPVGTDNCGGAVTSQIAGLGSGVSYPVGVTTNTFRVVDAMGLTATCSFTVTVTDNQLPVISCPSDITQSVAPGSCDVAVSYTNPVGNDNCPGASTTQPAGLPSGALYPFGVTTNTFKVTDAAGNTQQCSFNVVAELQVRTLNLKAFLEGFYRGSCQMCPVKDYDVNSNCVCKWGSTITDMITVELHDGANYSNIVYSDNNVQMNTDGTAQVVLPAIHSGNYYVTIRHRNHVETTTASPVSFAGCIMNYDFTTNVNQAYGGNMKTIGGVPVIYCGEITDIFHGYPGNPQQDVGIDLSDADYIFKSYLHGDYGYQYLSDVNGDGTVDLADIYLSFNNYLMSIQAQLP